MSNDLLNGTAVAAASNPLTLMMSFNNGELTTDRPNIYITIRTTGSYEYYRFSEDPAFTDATWHVADSPTIDFRLSPENGVKTIYGQVKGYGVTSAIASETITYIARKQEYRVTLSIDGNAASTPSRDVVVRLGAATITPRIYGYRISERYDFADTDWMRFSTETSANGIPFTLSEQAGKKRIYAQVRSSILSEVISETIYYRTQDDTEFNLTVSTGSEKTASRDIQVHISSQADWDYYRISEDFHFTGAAWKRVLQPAGPLAYRLTEEYGTKRLYVQVKNFERESEVITKTIEYQPLKIFNALEINNGDTDTYSTNVTVTIYPTIMPTMYIISESPTFSDVHRWEKWPNTEMTASVTYHLGHYSGLKTLYVKVRNDHQISDVASAQIRLNLPVIRITKFVANRGNRITFSRNIPVRLEANSLTHYRIGSLDDLSRMPWESYTSPDISYDIPVGYEPFGQNMICAQAMSGGIVSEVVNTFVTCADPARHALIALGYDWTAGPNLGASYHDAATGFNKVRIQENDYTTVYNLYNTAGNIMGTFTLDGLRGAGAYYVGNVTGDDSGVYPDMAIHFAAWKHGDVDTGVIRFDLPAGTWTVKALVNIVSHGLDFSQAVYELQTAGSENKRFTLPPSFDNNFTQTMDQTVTVQQGQPLYLKMHTPDPNNSILFLNALELIPA